MRIGSSARLTNCAAPLTSNGVRVSNNPRYAPTDTVPINAAGALSARTRRYASASDISADSTGADVGYEPSPVSAGIGPSPGRSTTSTTPTPTAPTGSLLAAASPPAHERMGSAPASSATHAETPRTIARVIAPVTVSAAAVRASVGSEPSLGEASAAVFRAAAICAATRGPVTTARKLKSLKEKLKTVVDTARPPRAAAAPSPSMRPTKAVSTAPRTGSRSREATAGRASAQMRASRPPLSSASSEEEEEEVDDSPGSTEAAAIVAERASRRPTRAKADRERPAVDASLESCRRSTSPAGRTRRIESVRGARVASVTTVAPHTRGTGTGPRAIARGDTNATRRDVAGHARAMLIVRKARATCSATASSPRVPTRALRVMKRPRVRGHKFRTSRTTFVGCRHAEIASRKSQRSVWEDLGRTN